MQAYREKISRFYLQRELKINIILENLLKITHIALEVNYRTASECVLGSQSHCGLVLFPAL